MLFTITYTAVFFFYFTEEVWKRMQKKKHININDTETNLVRCLSLKRLTFIGVGKTVGVGIYVLIGEATAEAGMKLQCI